MVMGKNTIIKNLFRSIRDSVTRYIAIVAIIALGAGIFVGLRTTKSDMIATGQAYMDSQNMFDLRLLNTYGWNQTDVDAVAQMEGVADVEGVISLDAIASRSDTGVEGVYKLYAIPDTVNKVYLLGGRMPESPEECLVDGSHATDAVLGTIITVSETNDDDTLESLKYHTFTVVGYVSTPLYMDMYRGTTTLGNGSVTSYLYMPKESFDVDYFTEIDVTIEGDYAVYSDEYNDAMDTMADYLKPLLMPLAQERYAQVMQEAEAAYADGFAEYEDGIKEYRNGKREAEQALADALEELHDAEEQIEANRQLLQDGENQLAAGQNALNSSSVTLSNSRQALAESKAEVYAQLAAASTELVNNYKTVSSSLQQIEDGLNQINAGLAPLEAGITQLEAGIKQLDITISIMKTMMEVLDASIETAEIALEQAQNDGVLDAETIQALQDRLQELTEKRNSYQAQYQELLNSRTEYSAQLAELKVQRDSILAQKTELESTKATLDEAMEAIYEGFLELETNQKEADNQFATAEAQIAAGEAQLDSAQLTLDFKQQELEDGKQALADAETQLAQGWADYREGADKTYRELADAELKLCDALVELRSARETIDAFTDPIIYALTRTTNVGYLSVDNNSDIVAGVARVFPAFFLLVAALVCITTMTRMVEEERTQIGTMKALGYGNSVIIGKYLAYAGSAAVLGCGMGVVGGSVIFPIILWQAYSIILHLTPNVILLLDPVLCIPVVVSYTAVTMLVTWYCCRVALREVPAELIRPKPPTSGKKIFLEYLPFWDKISFLNKVMLRNIFRYRQRFLMMLLGIGGCTALLVTGFGIKDSIVDIVSYQFEEVTLYDIEARFSDGINPDDQENFREEIGRYVDNIGFFYQNSVELDYDNATKEITLIASDESIGQFFDFHSDTAALELPGRGEAMLSIGVAENLGIKVGDTIVLRTSEMETLELTVSSIFNNNVYNYAIVSADTIVEQWGEMPESQMVFVTVRDDQDVHYASAKISAYDGIMSVSVSVDVADQVGSMLEAMNLVVVTVVICAGMLAVIVLYNLTNINITERIREIATLKVLGFYEIESAAYVFKENLLLSAMGAILGLFGGKLLLTFVMSQIKIDMVWFQARVLPISFVLSILLTMLSACLVDFILFFKLEKINMAEALKSVE